MDRQKWEGRLIDYIDGNATEAERAAIEHELLHNEAVRTLYNQLAELMGVINEAKVQEYVGDTKVSVTVVADETQGSHHMPIVDGENVRRLPSYLLCRMHGDRPADRCPAGHKLG